MPEVPLEAFDETAGPPEVLSSAIAEEPPLRAREWIASAAWFLTATGLGTLVCYAVLLAPLVALRQALAADYGADATAGLELFSPWILAFSIFVGLDIAYGMLKDGHAPAVSDL